MAYSRFRGRGQFTSPVSRSGRGFNYAGRSVRIKQGDFELTWNGPVIVEAVLTAVSEALTKLSDDALNYMRSITPVDTGNLRDSGFVVLRSVGDRVQLVIGNEARYAMYVELGTFKMAAQPYMRPTFDYVIQKLPGLIRSEVARRGG